MASNIPVTGPLAPYSNSVYPTHYSDYTHGGRHEVADLTARNKIDSSLLNVGMYVYVVSENTGYILTAKDADNVCTWTSETDYISSLNLIMDYGRLI